MPPKSKPRLCRICKQRPPWRYKNGLPGICKRCYHKHIWPDLLAAQRGRGEREEPLPDDPRRMIG